MNSWTRKLILSLALAWAACTPALAQGGAAAAPAAEATTAAKGPPAGFAAPALPKEDEGNAARAKSQPGNNAPMWRGVRESGQTPGSVNLPGAEKGVLIQSFVQYPGSSFTTAGEAWRQVRNQWIIPYGGSLILLVAAATALFYFTKGPIGGHEVNTGRLIERFTYLERVAHWSMAITFVVLAISGIVMAFGKFFLLPVLGATLFGWLSYALKTAHNFVGPLFAVSLVVFALIYIKDNLPKAADLAWLAKGGGLLSGKQVPSGRFNGGEKFVFWGGVIVLGLTVVASGLVLDLLIPGWGETRGQMQVAHMLHAAASALMTAMFIGHIYLGTIGVKGALDAMKTGYVDEAWAKEHHELWHDDVKAGRVPAIRSQSTPPMAAATSSPHRA
ncbi:MAG: formate dehydrogenase subunit gamma [Leptothrix sp. (in: Bacteria)]|nr:formate dehydrogenase subunit gamma [Leptothrix sp. (in: b-proteobacteria)]